MRSKDLSIQVKQALVRLQKQNKSILLSRDSRNIRSGQINSLVHSEKKECTGKLRHIRRPGLPWRTTVVDDRKILSMVKKTPLTTFSQVKNTLQEVDVSLSKSTIKRRLDKNKYRGFTTRCKQVQIRPKKTSKKAFFGRLKLRYTCTRMTERKKYGEGLEQLMIQSIQHEL